MSVAEKLTAIADNIRSHTDNADKLTLDDMAKGVTEVYDVGIAQGQDTGYEIGYTNGYIVGEENGYYDGYYDGYSDGYSDGYGEGLDHGVVQGIEEGLEEGIERGKKNAYDYFWDDFQQNGTRNSYISCFGSGWTVNTFKPKYQIKPVRAMNMFHNNYAEYLKIEDFVEFSDNLAKEQGKTPEKNPELFDENGHYNLLDFSECTSTGYSLGRLHSKHFGTLDFSKATGLVHLFYTHNYAGVCSVEKIDKFKSSAITQYDTTTFQGATYLTDITMSGVVAKSINFQNCPLTPASMKSVISCLKDGAGQTVYFSDSCWAALEADSSAPDGGTWKNYVYNVKGWDY